MKLLLTWLIVLISSIIGYASETNHFAITIIEKTQDSGLKVDGMARYTIRYVSSVSSQKQSGAYTLEEPREGAGLNYRGPIDRTVYWPDDFAQVNDIICKTNIGGRIYLCALPPTPIEPTESVVNRLKNRRDVE